MRDLRFGTWLEAFAKSSFCFLESPKGNGTDTILKANLAKLTLKS